MKLSVKLLVAFFISLFFFKNSFSQVAGWSEIGKMKFPVSSGQAVFNGSQTNPKIYILGGYSQVLQQVLNVVQVFDLTTYTWNVYPWNMKSTRQGFVAAYWDSSIVYFGGGDNDSLEGFNFYTSQKPLVLGQNINFNRPYSSGLVIGDELFIISGSFPPFDKLPFIVSYNLKKKELSYSYDFPSSAFLYSGDASVFQSANQIYILGGIINKYASKTIRSYDVIKKSLRNENPTPLLSVRAGAAATYLSSSKKGILIGGYNETTNALNTAEQIAVKPDGGIKVSQLPAMKYARRNPMIASYNGRVYVFGGTDLQNDVVSQVEMFADSVVTGIRDNTIPVETYLDQNYPNPFNPTTNIRFGLSKESHVTLTIYNVLGQEVTTLINNNMNAGFHSVNFDARHFTSGIYFYKIEMDNFIQVKKMMLLK